MTKARSLKEFDIWQGEFEGLKDDVIALRSDLAKLLSHVKVQSQDELANLSAQSAGAVSDTIADAKDWMGGQSKIVRRYVRKQPLQAFAIAIGVGALLGTFLSKR